MKRHSFCPTSDDEEAGCKVIGSTITSTSDDYAVKGGPCLDSDSRSLREARHDSSRLRCNGRNKATPSCADAAFRHKCCTDAALRQQRCRNAPRRQVRRRPMRKCSSTARHFRSFRKKDQVGLSEACQRAAFAQKTVPGSCIRANGCRVFAWELHLCGACAEHVHSCET